MKDLEKRIEIYWEARKIGFDTIRINYPELYEKLYPVIQKHKREFKAIDDALFYYLFIEKGEI